jgi:hypothetical protein
MPCYDPHYAEEDRQKQVEKLNDVTDKLCHVMFILERRKDGLDGLPKPILAWWKEHKEHDARFNRHGRCEPFKGKCVHCNKRAFRHEDHQLCCQCYDKKAPPEPQSRGGAVLTQWT